MKIKVLLVDDYGMTLEGLKRILGLDPEIEVVGVAKNGNEAIAITSNLCPDVIVIDLKMPIMDGIDTTRELKKRFPSVMILILTMCAEDLIERAMEAGASGYLEKDTASKEISNAIHQIYQGVFPKLPILTSGLNRELTDLRQKSESLFLTARETEVLKLIAKGKSTAEIGEQLYISLSTVKRELRRIFDRLGVKDRSHAISEAMKRKLIS